MGKREFFLRSLYILLIRKEPLDLYLDLFLEYLPLKKYIIL